MESLYNSYTILEICGKIEQNIEIAIKIWLATRKAE